LDSEAERARRVIVTDYAQAPEAPAALLALGRALGARNETLDEARSFLEKLVLDHPRSALLPQARQELDRLQGRIPKS
jgi:TolA-binding protein